MPAAPTPCRAAGPRCRSCARCSPAISPRAICTTAASRSPYASPPRGMRRHQGRARFFKPLDTLLEPAEPRSGFHLVRHPLLLLAYEVVLVEYSHQGVPHERLEHGVQQPVQASVSAGEWGRIEVDAHARAIVAKGVEHLHEAVPEIALRAEDGQHH